MTMRRFGTAALLAVMAFGLIAGCESSKDKAARYLQSALELQQKGDLDRAIVEFRNVFKLDAENRDARMAFATLLKDRGSLPEAYAQYQQVIERTPDDQEALMAAASLAAEMGNWQDAGKRADAALVLTPGAPQMLAVRAAVDYAAAFSAADLPARAQAAARAQTLLAAMPDSLLLHRVVIDNLIQNKDYPAALAAIDRAQAAYPTEKGLFQLRVLVLAANQDNAAVEAELLKMVTLFADDPTVGEALMRWYMSHDQIDKAEAYLRGKADAGDMRARMSLVDFLRQFRSVDAALAEIDTILAQLAAQTAAEPAPADAAAAPATTEATDAAPPITVDIVRTLRASILFDQGKHDDAIKEMQNILTTATPSEQTRQIKVTLARMQFEVGNSVQARALVEEVLAEDAGQVDALKLKAAGLIGDDKPDDAVALLRTALDSNPRDPQTMALMAQAYERTGSKDLAGDMLSQAVAASGKAPLDSIRYADFLMKDAKYLPAETILVDALRLDPGNVALLSSMGRLYVLMADWSRATGVADRLDELGTPAAKAAVQELRPTILANQENLGSAIDYLEGLAAGQDSNLDAQVSLLRAYLANGQNDQAKTMVQSMLAKAPGDATLRFIAATVKSATGDGAGATADFRAMVAEDPKRLNVWALLVRQLAHDKQPQEAEAALEEALATNPDDASLLLIKATFLERRQDADGAIAIYEKLYAVDSANLVLANNLASMLASFKSDDKASLERAFVVARRLRDTTEPAFADTYGWIAYLRGTPQEALAYLETAAKGLPDDPMVQFHLAEVYQALKRAPDALAQYKKVVDMVAADDSRPFVEAARKAVSEGG